MTRKQQNILLELLRKALNLNANGNPSPIPPNHDDWGNILSALDDNGLIGGVAETIKALPEEQRPSEKQMQRIDEYMTKLNFMRYHTGKVIDRVFGALRDAGCSPVLIKGEGLAAIYPKGCHRSIGDVDVFVREEEFERACRAMDRLNGVTQDASAYYAQFEHHYETYLDYMVVEIHHNIAESKKEEHADLMNEWAQRTINGVPQITQINTDNIVLPPVQFDMFYVFEHMAKHLFMDYSGLRQIIDWTVYMHHVYRNSLEYDKEALYRILKETNLLRAWQVLAGIAHYNLGLSQEEIPFYDDRMARKSQGRILGDIVINGNFGGHRRREYLNVMPHGIKRYCCIVRDLWWFYRTRRIYFPEKAWKELLTGMVKAVGHQLRLVKQNPNANLNPRSSSARFDKAGHSKNLNTEI